MILGSQSDRTGRRHIPSDGTDRPEPDRSRWGTARVASNSKYSIIIDVRQILTEFVINSD